MWPSRPARPANVTSPLPLSADEALARALLTELAQHPGGISLPRLRKRLNARMSVLMRVMAWLGEAPIGGVPGAGLLQLQGEEGREQVLLTPRGVDFVARAQASEA